MKKILGVILVVGVVAFASMQVGASVNENKAIGLDKGVNVALQDAGFKSDEVDNLTAHYDSDDGIATYEVSFTSGEIEYEYTVKASDGTILEADRETIKPAAAQAAKTVQEVKPVQEAKPAQEVQQQPSEPTSKYIGVDKAKSIALGDAGVKSSEATFTKAKLDKEDGVAVYEIEFYSGGIEYEYEISASSGKILDKDWDNEWDD